MNVLRRVYGFLPTSGCFCLAGKAMAGVLFGQPDCWRMWGASCATPESALKGALRGAGAVQLATTPYGCRCASSERYRIVQRKAAIRLSILAGRLNASCATALAGDCAQRRRQSAVLRIRVRASFSQRSAGAWGCRVLVERQRSNSFWKGVGIADGA